MTAIQSGSDGLYSKRRNLYFRIDVLKNEILGRRYFGPIQRKRADTELANLKTELKKLNAEIRKGESYVSIPTWEKETISSSPHKKSAK